MPHLTVHVLEEQLAGRESDLIAALTDAVVEVYGDWARDIAVVHLVGVPAGRWGVGGRPTDSFAPAITFGVREIALTRPDDNEIAARLVAAVTEAVARVFGEEVRSGVSIELVGTPEGRTAVGGTILMTPA